MSASSSDLPLPDTPSSNRERDVFAAALECPGAAERTAYLDEACAGDAALRARIENLLGAAEQAGGFLLDSSPDGAGQGPGAAGVTAEASDAAASAVADEVGSRIGRYKILERIGEGGFGVVYMAEQEEPVRRRVALKIIKLGMDTRAIVARFEAERQALAMMDHPNIAKVLDGGATPAGRPYFVMDLVRGVPITTFCSEHRLTTRERIELFMQVCQAVLHAHQKGIIHRDLKPSNILVTMHDDRPVPKVIDFGIAKATDQRLTDKTLFTRFHQFVGTPVYMSPEQTGMSGVDVDTRADIYSLGVLLYELLTGRTPFDSATLAKAGLEEIHRTIREQDPPAPSRRLAALTREERTVTAQRHRVDPAKLSSDLRGDLDLIVMKCLAKDRARRYDTASALAMDLVRHLNNEPVRARSDTWTYRASRFSRRHVRGVTTTAVVLAGLVTLLVFHTRRMAVERDRARLEAVKAARVTELLTSLLTGADPYRTPDPEAVTVRGLLDAGAERVERELEDQPGLQAEMFTVIGRVFVRLGLHDKAKPLLERALAVERVTGGTGDLLAETLMELGVLVKERGDYAAAESLLKEAVALRRARHEPGNEIAYALVELGRVYMDWGDLDTAEGLFRESLAMRRTALGEEHRNTAVSHGDLGTVLMRKDDFRAAEPHLREALAINRKVLGDHANTAGAMSNLAQALTNKGDFAEAEALYRESIAMFRRHVGDRHWRVANILNNLGAMLRKQGRFEEAASVLKEAFEMAQEGLGPEHTLVSFILVNRARMQLDLGVPSEAERLLREALPIQERAYRKNHARLAATKSLLGEALIARKDYQEAERLLLEARAVLKGVSGPEAREAEATRRRLVTLYESWGKPGKAAEPAARGEEDGPRP